MTDQILDPKMSSETGISKLTKLGKIYSKDQEIFSNWEKSNQRSGFLYTCSKNPLNAPTVIFEKVNSAYQSRCSVCGMTHTTTSEIGHMILGF